LGDAPFGYVNIFTSHVNVGFFHGALLPDPARLLQGTGKFMRHVKLRPRTVANAAALKQADRYGILGYKGARRKWLAQRNALREVDADVNRQMSNDMSASGMKPRLSPQGTGKGEFAGALAVALIS
jgi:hypothetical protein